ncbi:helix-turn-helix domain-containing protein [Brevibacillus formosus]|uniref:helix-turn-helix domain-containing protein n=1 Tax=Brevibacillus formosus TaxID=54913 RepID=UPI0018CCD5FC|nr:helix-turn-helix domain-containing protein [Brevibacillus formosus]MBG9941783.1 hypothetical protein [Brevibacillus formosus]
MNDTAQVKTEIMTAKDAAVFLNISYWKLTDMAKKRQIPHFRAGSRLLFRVDSLKEWISNQEVASMQQEEFRSPEVVKLRRIQ